MSEALPPVTSLYNRQILGEAVKLARWPLKCNLAVGAEKRSKTCGSVVRIGLNIDDQARITEIGLQVHACALGQASAAIVAQNIIGSDEAHLRQSLQALRQFLEGNEAASPPWSAYDMLVAARRYPARHASIMLPLEVALIALENARSSNSTLQEEKTNGC